MRHYQLLIFKLKLLNKLKIMNNLIMMLQQNKLLKLKVVRMVLYMIHKLQNLIYKIY